MFCRRVFLKLRLVAHVELKRIIRRERDAEAAAEEHRGGIFRIGHKEARVTDGADRDADLPKVLKHRILLEVDAMRNSVA